MDSGLGHFSRSLTALADGRSGPVTKPTETRKRERGDSGDSGSLRAARGARPTARHVPAASRPAPRRPARGTDAQASPLRRAPTPSREDRGRGTPCRAPARVAAACGAPLRCEPQLHPANKSSDAQRDETACPRPHGNGRTGTQAHGPTGPRSRPASVSFPAGAALSSQHGARTRQVLRKSYLFSTVMTELRN